MPSGTAGDIQSPSRTVFHVGDVSDRRRRRARRAHHRILRRKGRVAQRRAGKLLRPREASLLGRETSAASRAGGGAHRTEPRRGAFARVTGAPSGGRRATRGAGQPRRSTDHDHRGGSDSKLRSSLLRFPSLCTTAGCGRKDLRRPRATPSGSSSSTTTSFSGPTRSVARRAIVSFRRGPIERSPRCRQRSRRRSRHRSALRRRANGCTTTWCSRSRSFPCPISTSSRRGCAAR